MILSSNVAPRGPILLGQPVLQNRSSSQCCSELNVEQWLVSRHNQLLVTNNWNENQSAAVTRGRKRGHLKITIRSQMTGACMWNEEHSGWVTRPRCNPLRGLRLQDSLSRQLSPGGNIAQLNGTRRSVRVLELLSRRRYWSRRLASGRTAATFRRAARTLARP